jgi:hypothetical protein
VTVTTAAERHEQLVSHVPGGPARPFDEGALKQKFIRVTAPVFETAQAGAMFARILAAPHAPSALLQEIDRLQFR